MNELWNHACKIIPGGNQLVSKRPDRYCPGKYPSHYYYAHGNLISSVNDKTYIDFSTMGIGACILGYGNADVDAAVIKAIAAGNMSSLNCIEELELAEEMLRINPNHDMVKFARTGGEACKIALTIAQKFAGRTWWAQHGYSGWMLGTPERSKGVDFYDIEFLDSLTCMPSCVIMEPVRNYPDESIKLMKEVRKWCTDNNVILIFDEITSGFRCNIGGYHRIKEVYPDIAIYGKALGNGYPISAITGKGEIMEAVEDTFVSSTFWSERTGYAAALATIDVMKKQHVPDNLIRIGRLVQDGWRSLAEINDLDIEVMGIYPLSHFEFKKNHNELITLFTQEMLKRNILATDQFYSSIAHSNDDIESYLFHVDEVFTMISEGKIKLEGPVRTPGWKRMN